MVIVGVAADPFRLPSIRPFVRRSRRCTRGARARQLEVLPSRGQPTLAGHAHKYFGPQQGT
eukprot:scaffold28641_cov31-Tisochrysis_lutea.AAC.5